MEEENVPSSGHVDGHELRVDFPGKAVKPTVKNIGCFPINVLETKRTLTEAWLSQVGGRPGGGTVHDGLV